VKTVILCGGQGTRLREETEYRPKPMVNIGGRPILWHIMKHFSHFGHRDFVLCLGYRGQMIKEYFLNYEAMNKDFTLRLGKSHETTYHSAHGEQEFSVTLSDTGVDTMTGGRVKRVSRYVDGDEFFLTYGDGLADVDLAKLLSFHRAHNKMATITAVRPVSRFGMLQMGSDGLVKRFAEKPQAEGWINAGFMILKPAVFDFLGGDECIFEQEPLERLAASGQLMAYQHSGFFFAMDTYREYLQLNQMWDEGLAPWKSWT
jgi:glucose-1-phosphate cytidylyltransferase